MRTKLYLANIVALFVFGFTVQAQPTAFTYQGKLTDGAAAASGTYEMQFRLFASISAPIPLATITNNSVSVVNGVFTVQLDFGSTVFADNPNPYLEIGVRKAADPPGFTILTPRQPITSAPFAIRALSAATVNNVSGVVAIANGGTGATSASAARANLGAGATSGDLSQFAATTSDQLASVITNETGTGPLVFAQGASLSAPSISSPSITGNPAYSGGHANQFSIQSSLASGSRSTPVFAISQPNDAAFDTFATLATITQSDTGSGGTALGVPQAGPGFGVVVSMSSPSATGLYTNGKLHVDADVILAGGRLNINATSGASTFNGSGEFFSDLTVGGALRAGGVAVLTPSAAQFIDAASDTILANAAHVKLNPTNNFTLTSTPTIADGVEGQLIYVRAISFSATLQDQDTLAGSNLQLGAASRTVGVRDVLVLMYDGSDWVEVSYSNN